MKISCDFTVYNQMPYIRRTLECMVNEVDEIVISDNASTDGSAEVCQEFADKYPKIIKFFRQEKNIGAARSHLFAFDKTTGDYIRFIGTHDLCSAGSTRHMVSLLEQTPNASICFSKWVIHLGPDYMPRIGDSDLDGRRSLYVYPDDFQKGISDDNEFVRIKSLWSGLRDWSMLFGVYTFETVRRLTMEQSNGFMLPGGVLTDNGMFTYLAKQGKMIVDDQSVFFRMANNHPDETPIQKNKRILDAYYGTGHGYNPMTYDYENFAEIYDMVSKMQEQPNAPKNFKEEMLEIIARMFFWRQVDFDTSALPPMTPEKQRVFKGYIEELAEFQQRKYARKGGEGAFISSFLSRFDQ